MELTDEQWATNEPVFRHKQRGKSQPGRPPREPREVLEAVLWVLRTGAPWAELPNRYPPYQTCHRWFQTWSKTGKLKQALATVAGEIRQRRTIDEAEGYIDGSYVRANNGGACVGKCRAGKATKIMALADSTGLPIAVAIFEGSRHDVALVDITLDEAVTHRLPARVIGDKAFDSVALATRLHEERNIELIAPKRKGSCRRVQDGRAMRRYKRRWKVERLFAWLKRFRRIATRWERLATNYLGFVQLAAAAVILRFF
jgi:transposase